MAEQIEQLTEEERRWLEADPEFQKWDVRRKVLRIIDAHAADRAALMARVAELERQQTGFQLRFDGPPGPEGPRFIESETLDGRSVSLGEWEQDGECWLLKVHVFRSNAAESEVARLREALAAEKAHSADTAAAYAAKSEALILAEARVRELEADVKDARIERDEARAVAAHVERITAWANQCLDKELSSNSKLATAESEVAALRADYQAALDQEHRLAVEWKARYEAECVEHAVTRDQLEAANALLRRMVKYVREDRATTPGVTRLARLTEEADAHLSAQPTARAEAEQLTALHAENTTLRVNNRVLEADNADLLDSRRQTESQLVIVNTECAKLQEEVGRLKQAIETFLEEGDRLLACIVRHGLEQLLR